MFQVDQFIEIMFVSNPIPRHGIVHEKVKERITIRCNQEDVHRLVCGQEVILTQVCNNNVCQITTPILECEGCTFTVARSHPRIIERRLSGRIACEIEATYCHELLIPLRQREQPTETGKARVRNISMGGALLYTEHLLPINVCFELQFCLEPGSPLVVRAETLECLLLSTDTKARFPNLHYATAVKFVELSRAMSMQIQRYVGGQFADIYPR